MRKNQRCKASAVARGNARCDDPEKEEEPDVERQLLSSTDQKSFQPDIAAVSVASSNSNCESMNANPRPPHDTRDSDPAAHRSLLALAEIRSRPHTRKGTVWFLRTTSWLFQLPCFGWLTGPGCSLV